MLLHICKGKIPLPQIRKENSVPKYIFTFYCYFNDRVHLKGCDHIYRCHHRRYLLILLCPVKHGQQPIPRIDNCHLAIPAFHRAMDQRNPKFFRQLFQTEL